MSSLSNESVVWPKLRALAFERDPALLAGRVGRWRWYWLFVGNALLVVLLAGALMAAGWADEWVSGLFGRGGSFEEDVLYTANRPATFIGICIASLAFVLPVIIVLQLVHGQSWRLALGRDGRFSWSDFGKAATASFVVFFIVGAVEYVIFPERLSVRSHGIAHLPWVLLAALVTFPQAFSEDFLFKGYVTRIWGAVVPFRIFVVLAAGMLFTSLHSGNSDVKADLWFMLIGFLLGDLLMLTMYLRAGSLGAVTGLHWMNNVMVICLVTRVPGYKNELALMEYRDPVLMAGKSHLTNPESWATLIVGFLLLYFFLTWRRSPFSLPYVPVPVAPAEAVPEPGLKEDVDPQIQHRVQPRG